MTTMKRCLLSGLIIGALCCWLPVSGRSSWSSLTDDDDWGAVDTIVVDSAVVDSVCIVETISDIFRQIPDSLMPSLSLNSRLDFIDFRESNMKAEVVNLLGGTSEMTALTDDSLSIRMNDALRVDMLLLNLDESTNSIHEVVVFVETFLSDSIYGESSVKLYSTDWQPVKEKINWNDSQKQRLEGLCLQNILNWDDDKLNNR